MLETARGVIITTRIITGMNIMWQMGRDITMARGMIHTQVLSASDILYCVKRD